MNAVEFWKITFGYQKELLFRDFSLLIKAGEFLGVVGPNGSGKSTLLKLMMRIVNPLSGRVNIFGNDSRKIERLELARQMALVPQGSYFVFDWTVEEVVMMGRNPYRHGFFQSTRRDREKVVEAMHMTGVFDLRFRSINAISAGERQRVIIARALAQEPALLLLDEATAHLDLGHRAEVLRLLLALQKQGKTIVLVSHDLNEAFGFCSRIAFLKAGQLLACDAPDKLDDPGLVKNAYGINPVVIKHPETGRPQFFLPAEPEVSEPS
uniref:ABC transporter ATP-binding protein n=1 Tax=candidate division WOR-3 bacterium TaxID=2052148 RepID=A0A7V3PU91_UNCW3